jgi:hypothetical protein
MRVKCRVCGGYGFNLWQRGIEQGDLCDADYWQGKYSEELKKNRALENVYDKAAMHMSEIKVVLDGFYDQKQPITSKVERMRSVMGSFVGGLHREGEILSWRVVSDEEAFLMADDEASASS